MYKNLGIKEEVVELAQKAEEELKDIFEQIDEIFKINSIAPSYLISKVVPYMKEIKWEEL